MRGQNQLVVRGANKRKRHAPTTETGKGGIFQAEGPLHYSAVSLLDPSSK
jgi:ribosomal protein L24